MHAVVTNRHCSFPDKKFLEWDCGKFKFLRQLLTRLQIEGHKVVLFTQMSKMLDIIEGFVNLCGFTYVRLDGTTKVADRQLVVDKFNASRKIFLFISSTRAGGVGINLTSADTVVFFDSDWNPAMDKQAMDRCHRIGQVRDVHIYRLISEKTIEENIFVKQLQKRKLDEIVIDQSRGQGEDIETIVRKDNKLIDDLLGGIFGDSDQRSNIYGTHILWERENVQVTDEKFESLISQVEDPEDVSALKVAEEESGDTTNEDKEFNALLGIVKKSVLFVEARLDAEKEEQNRLAQKHDDESDWEALENAEWESEVSDDS
jgi:superfamily II DNA/RNA helicase